MDLTVVLKGAAPPIVAAALFVGLAGVRLLPLAVAVGLFVAFGLLKGWSDWPTWPHQLWAAPNGTQWLLWGVFAACLVALLEHLRALPAKAAPLVGALVGGAAVWFLLRRLIAVGGWDVLELLLYVGGGGLAVALLVLACRTALVRGPAGLGPAIVFSTLLSADAALLALSSGLLGQLCGAVAAATGAAAATAMWRRPFALAPADSAWLGASHGLFVLAGAHLAGLPWPAAGLALLAPCALLLLQPVAARRPGWWLGGALVFTLLPLAGAFWWALGAGGPGW